MQFVPYREFSKNGELLAKEVLAELPDQVVEYHRLIGKKPNPPVQVQMDQIQVVNLPQATQSFGANLIKGGFMQKLIGNALQNPQLNDNQQQQMQGQNLNPFGDPSLQMQPNQGNQPFLQQQQLGGFIQPQYNQPPN